ncbi:MAG: crossover junction endodeoxyribonuclease RuvC [Pseudomonadales bacterium]
MCSWRKAQAPPTTKLGRRAVQRSRGRHVSHHLPVAEYEARKNHARQWSAATKLQVQHMVKTLLSLAGDPQEDAADALAVALCHAHTQKSLIHAADSAGKFRRGRIR